MNTRIDYMYRDADNYKQHGHVVVAGELSDMDKGRILAKLDGGENFIPSQVGLPDLQELFGNLDQQSDHCWHELYPDDIQPTDAEPTISMTAAELLERFLAVDEWDVVAGMEAIGLDTSLASMYQSRGWQVTTDRAKLDAIAGVLRDADNSV